MNRIKQVMKSLENLACTNEIYTRPLLKLAAMKDESHLVHTAAATFFSSSH